MKKLLVLLFSLFILSSQSVFADDISDFQIEGISIGDSLLDYMTEDEILEEIEATKDLNLHLNEPNKYLVDTNEKYTILSIRAFIHFVENPDICIEKRNEIAGIFYRMFPNSIKNENFLIHTYDPSGNSTADSIYLEDYSNYIFVKVTCTDWEENFRINNSFSEGLTVSIRTGEVKDWSQDWAQDYLK